MAPGLMLSCESASLWSERWLCDDAVGDGPGGTAAPYAESAGSAEMHPESSRACARGGSFRMGPAHAQQRHSTIVWPQEEPRSMATRACLVMGCASRG
jgi:hypothetical protein